MFWCFTNILSRNSPPRIWQRNMSQESYNDLMQAAGIAFVGGVASRKITLFINLWACNISTIKRVLVIPCSFSTLPPYFVATNKSRQWRDLVVLHNVNFRPNHLFVAHSSHNDFPELPCPILSSFLLFWKSIQSRRSEERKIMPKTPTQEADGNFRCGGSGAIESAKVSHTRDFGDCGKNEHEIGFHLSASSTESFRAALFGGGLQ